MAGMEPEKSREIDRLIDELAMVKAKLALLEWREQAEAILEEMREIRDQMKETQDDFVRILKATGKILLGRDQAIWQHIIRKMLKDQGQNEPKKRC